MEAGGLAAAVLVALLPVGAAWGQATGNPALGHAVARTWCANCHVVDAEQQVSTAAGEPSFQSIADKPSSTSAVLHGFLASSHPPMPDFQLSRQQADDVTAYIMSLKRR